MDESRLNLQARHVMWSAIAGILVAVTMVIALIFVGAAVVGGRHRAGTPLGTDALAVARSDACTHDATWSGEGSELLAGERQHPSTNDGPTSTTVQTPFAYQSLPVDIAGPGTYTFTFGPLTQPFHWGIDPFGLATYWPQDFNGSANPAGGPRVVSLHGSTYVRLAVAVDSPSTCSGLTLWVY